MSTAESSAVPSDTDLPKGTVDILVTSEHIDSLGHVNNAVYVQFFELGRVAFYKQLELRLEADRAPRMGTVVVNLNVNFRDECVAGDRLRLITRGHRRGNRSFVLMQHLTRLDGAAVADCIATNVMMDLDSRSVAALPDSLCAALPPPSKK